MALGRYTWRAMQQRPGRTILTVLSIVIGVTAAVAIHLGTATTRNAYKQMFAMVTGKATLEIDAAGGGGFPQDVFDKVVAAPGVVAATPLVDRPTSLSMEGGERRVRLQVLGIDVDRDRSVREYEIVSGRPVRAGEDELVLEEGFANYLGLKVGDEIKLLTKRLSKPFTVVGLLRSQTGAAFTQTAMAFLPLDRAQYHFNPSGQRDLIDKVQLVTAPEVEPEAVQAQIAALLPEGLQVHRPAASTQLMRETLLSTEQGLKLTTYFTLLMASFIIFNTFLMNVSERRRHLSIMRAVGALRGQIARALIAESLMLGVVGTLIGMGCGVVLAFLGTYFVGRAFEVQLPRLVEVMTIWPFVIGGVFGLVMAFFGAVVPALIAGRVSPLEGMNRVVGQPKRSFTLLFLVGGLLLTVGGFGVIFGSIGGWLPIDWATIAAVALLIGLVMLDSLVLGPQTSLAAALFRPLFRVETALAQKQVLRHHLRSALTVGVLFIAGSTGVGMANSILDSVRDVHEWYDQAIQGDYFVRAMMPDMATGTSADLPDGLGEDLARVPHIRTLDGAAFVEGKIPQAGVDPSEYLTVIVIARDFNEKYPPFDLVEGDRSQVGEQIRAGQVVIGTVLSQRLGLHAGDELPLETKDGVQKAKICGVANEYMVGGLAVHMFRPLAVKWLGVEGVDGYVLKVEEGYREAVRPQLEQIARKYDVILMSHGDIRKTVDQFVSGTEWSLWLLVWMGFVVASFGVVNTLTMNVLEQTRELGLLRIVAMTKKQVRRTILAQALIIGGVGLPPGVAMGVVIAYVINLAMMPSFGHPIDFHFYPRMVLFTLAGALVIVVAAAIIPARRATQINLVEALHYE